MSLVRFAGYLPTSCLDRFEVIPEYARQSRQTRSSMEEEHMDQQQESSSSTEVGITLPIDSALPKSYEARSVKSHEETYDKYFDIHRTTGDLVEWSRSCVNVLGEFLRDLEVSNLEPAEKSELLSGLLTLQLATLERWIKVADSTE
jgi:hypothetical protein